jgi:hypothetical protein
MLAEWNRQDLTDFDPVVYFGNVNGNFTGSISMSIETFRGVRNLLRIDFTNFFGGAFIGFTGTFEQTRYMHHIETASGSAAFTEAYFFVAPFINPTTKNGLLMGSRFSANTLGGLYLANNSSSLINTFGATWIDVDGTYFKNQKIYTNFKPTGSHLQYRLKGEKTESINVSYGMTSLSHSAPAAWSGSSFNKTGIGVLITGSVPRTGYILISEVSLIKHPYDIDS